MNGKRARILCANCNICVNNIRRYHILEQNTRVCTTLCNWIHPKIATDNDYVCEACLDLAVPTVSKNIQNNTKIDLAGVQRGHTNVCLLCGSSLKRKQSDKILRANPTELQQSIIQVIQSQKEPEQISDTDRVCHGCWLRAKRTVLRSIKAAELRLQEETTDHVNDTHISDQNAESSTEENLKPGTIILPNYRRAANTGKHCVFHKCPIVGTLHTVSDKLRSIILRNNNFYVPKLARVCGVHMLQNSWGDLYESRNSINVFNVDHIQHVFSLVNAFNPKMNPNSPQHNTPKKIS